MSHKCYDRLIFGLVIIFLVGLTALSEAQSEFQLQPITTTVLCNNLTTCITAGLPNVSGAILRRPTSDVLGHMHTGIEITHDFSSYINNPVCSALAQRGYTTLCADGQFTS